MLHTVTLTKCPYVPILYDHDRRYKSIIHGKKIQNKIRISRYFVLNSHHLTNVILSCLFQNDLFKKNCIPNKPPRFRNEQ